MRDYDMEVETKRLRALELMYYAIVREIGAQDIKVSTVHLWPQSLIKNAQSVSASFAVVGLYHHPLKGTRYVTGGRNGLPVRLILECSVLIYNSGGESAVVIHAIDGKAQMSVSDAVALAVGRFVTKRRIENDE